MDKLEQLEEALKYYREELEKQMVNTSGMPPGTAGGDMVNATAAPADMEKQEHDDEKEDKKLIEKEIDEHNEKKHGEAKDEDSAMKTELVKFDDNGQWSLEKAQGGVDPKDTFKVHGKGQFKAKSGMGTESKGTGKERTDDWSQGKLKELKAEKKKLQEEK